MTGPHAAAADGGSSSVTWSEALGSEPCTPAPAHTHTTSLSDNTGLPAEVPCPPRCPALTLNTVTRRLFSGTDSFSSITSPGPKSGRRSSAISAASRSCSSVCVG